jgi:NAD(P)-dependent dehydrogenase (short-subunit alcohol dehydrogenase family)
MQSGKRVKIIIKGKIDPQLSPTIVISAEMTEQAILENPPHEHFDKQFNVNVRSTFLTAWTGLPLLRNKRAIVLVSSDMHLKGISAHSVYASTKVAVRSFTGSWATELKDRGILVNRLSPGAIGTLVLDSQAKTPQEVAALRATYARMTTLGPDRAPRRNNCCCRISRFQRKQLHRRLRSEGITQL